MTELGRGQFSLRSNQFRHLEKFRNSVSKKRTARTAACAHSPLVRPGECRQPRRPMRFIETVFQKLKRHPKRIVFPEGTEPRVLRAAARFVKLQLGAPVVLGKKDEIEKIALAEDISLDHVGIVDPAASSELPAFIQRLEKLKRYHDIGPKQAADLLEHSAQGIELYARMGDVLGRLAPPAACGNGGAVVQPA